MEALEQAQELLTKQDLTFVIVSGREVISSKDRGIRPLLEQIRKVPEKLKDASVADKVIGKSAALLYAYAGIKNVYGQVISNHAILVFEKCGISYHFAKKVPNIINREGNGMCPMEQAVLLTESPEEAYQILSERIGKGM